MRPSVEKCSVRRYPDQCRDAKAIAVLPHQVANGPANRHKRPENRHPLSNFGSNLSTEHVTHQCADQQTKAPRPRMADSGLPTSGQTCLKLNRPERRCRHLEVRVLRRGGALCMMTGSPQFCASAMHPNSEMWELNRGRQSVEAPRR